MDLTQVNFETMQLLERRFEVESVEMNDLYHRTHMMVDHLVESYWSGSGADRFYDEMYEVVLPALDRLVQALAEASLQTRQIAHIYQQAQEQAADHLRYVLSSSNT